MNSALVKIKISDELIKSTYIIMYATLQRMALLSNEIYCKKRILSMAEGCSYKASHVSRRLLEGIYKREALVKYTFTGKQIHCGCLDRNARIAIIEHSMDIGSKRGWQSQSVYDLNRAMSQKVSELKRLYNRI